jgi:hypothetical protein
VVNIDNGFGAGYQASLINKIGTRHHENCTADAGDAGRADVPDAGTAESDNEMKKAS